jgi:hypothetical protein
MTMIVMPIARASFLSSSTKVFTSKVSPAVVRRVGIDGWKASTIGDRSFFGSAAGTKNITKDEVRALFGLWNDALATGDSRVVASRYAQEATLLPTVRLLFFSFF